MSTMIDPYDYIEWKPDRNSRIATAFDDGKERKRGRNRRGEGEKQWRDYVYDVIVLCILATVLATLFKLLLY